VSARVGRLRVAVSEVLDVTLAVEGLIEAGHTEAARSVAAQELSIPVGAPNPRGSAKFLARANDLLAAIEIALPLRLARETGWNLQSSLMGLAREVEFIGSGQVHTLAQLRYVEEDFFTYWNEAPDSETRPFWQQVHAAGLPYQRVDHLGKIFTRGRIASRTEYEFAVDSVVVAVQDGRLTQADASRLAQLIGAYEGRGRQRRLR